LKSVEEYLVSVGPRDLSGQIDVPKGSTLKPQVGGYGAVYKGTWKRKIDSEVKVSFPGLYMLQSDDDRLPLRHYISYATRTGKSREGSHTGLM